MIITTGIAYPLLVTAIGQTTMPYQSNGSQVVLDGKVVGSELIAQSFTSAKFFQPRNDSGSGVDPDITPNSAISQIPTISNATGIPVNALKTLVDLDIARNKETNALVFAPDYVNVLNLNIELVKQYPDVYAQETSAKGVP
jgi:K+-transporting ATPase ATPase C chain